MVLFTVVLNEVFLELLKLGGMGSILVSVMLDKFTFEELDCSNREILLFYGIYGGMCFSNLL